MLALALPVVVSELGWMGMGVADTIMVGRLGAEAIGAVGIGNVVFFSVAIFGIGALLGLDAIVSQAFGAGDLRRCHRAMFQGVYLGLAISPILMGVIALGNVWLKLSGVDPGVLAPTGRYISIMLWGLPPLMVFFAIRRYLQGMNLVAPVMVALVLANLANLAGNWVFVYGRLGFPAMGVAGSAWSTVASRFVMLAIVAGYALWHGVRKRTGLLTTPLGIDGPLLKELIVLGFPSAVHLTLEVAVFGAAALLAGRLGSNALAAHEVVLQIAGTTFMVPLGVSSAGAVRVGQALGRDDPAGAARSGWTAILIGAGFMAISGTTMTLLPGPLLGIFTTDPGILAVARTLLIAAAVFQVFDGIQVVGTGVLRGAGETRLPMFANLAAYWAVGLPMGYVLGFVAGWGVLGIWIGLTSGLILTGIIILMAWTRAVGRLGGSLKVSAVD